MQKKIFPIILIEALLVSSLVSLFFIHNLQGNAKVINYAGVVRGATPVSYTHLDEPTGNLDRKNSREIIDMLKLSNQSLNQTILLITHDESIALEAGRIITIEDGHIISDRKRG